MTKSELEILERNREKIICLKNALRTLETRSIVQAQKITGMPRGGSTGDPVANAGASNADAESELNEVKLESMLIVREVREEPYHQVLDLYYVDAKEFDEIADIMKYSSYQSAYSVLYRFKKKLQ